MNSLYKTKAAFHYEKASQHNEKALEFQLSGNHLKYAHHMRLAGSHLRNAQFYSKAIPAGTPEVTPVEEAVFA
jgi:hypothetical protein